MIILYITLICILIASILVVAPVLLSTYRDYSNLEEGDRICIRLTADSKDPTIYYSSVVERAPEDPSILVYSDGLDYHVLHFSDFLHRRVMTEEQYDALTD